MQELPLNKAFMLLEPGPVVLVPGDSRELITFTGHILSELIGPKPSTT